jgi:hypothetical protein
MDEDESRREQIDRLKQELVELKPPLDEKQFARLLEILDEMDELREWLDASLRAARLPPVDDDQERIN